MLLIFSFMNRSCRHKIAGLLVVPVVGIEEAFRRKTLRLFTIRIRIAFIYKQKPRIYGSGVIVGVITPIKTLNFNLM